MLLVKFCRWNPVISIGHCTIRSFMEGRRNSSHFLFMLVIQYVKVTYVWCFIHINWIDNGLFFFCKHLRRTMIVEFVKHENLHPVVSVLIEKAIFKTFLSTWYLRYVTSIVEQKEKVSSSNVQHISFYRYLFCLKHANSEQFQYTNLLQHHVNIVEINVFV